MYKRRLKETLLTAETKFWNPSMSQTGMPVFNLKSLEKKPNLTSFYRCILTLNSYFFCIFLPSYFNFMRINKPSYNLFHLKCILVRILHRTFPFYHLDALSEAKEKGFRYKTLNIFFLFFELYLNVSLEKYRRMGSHESLLSERGLQVNLDSLYSKIFT